MGQEADGAGSSATAAQQLPVSTAQAGAAPAGGAASTYPPPGTQQQAAPGAYYNQYPPPQAGGPYGAAPGASWPPPAGYGGAPGAAPYYNAPPPNARPPLVSIISPEDAKRIRTMQLVNFVCTMLQLVCSLAIIIIVRQSLIVFAFTGNSPIPTVQCLAATPAEPSTCEYAYSLASVSIFFGFILSLMQCLTMDCCGAGRLVEAGFDAAAAMWWIAGGITLGIRASEANAAGIPNRSARNGVVALCWISAALFLVLLGTNLVLIKRLGRAYKAAVQQMQQHATAHPASGHPYPGVTNVQMVPMGMGGPAPGGPGMVPGGAPAGYAPQGAAAAGGMAAAGMPPQGPPAGYPTQFVPQQPAR